MVSLTALVLTITMVVVQLAMGQFSPRIVQRILRDKPSQLAIGLFVATFVHAILTLREVTNNGDGTGHVPGIAVVTAFVLVLASIAVLVIYVHHIGQALRVSALIELVGKDTRKLLDRIYPDQGRRSTPEPQDRSRRARQRVRRGHRRSASSELVEEARRADCVLELVPALGEFVPAGAPLFRVHGEPERPRRGPAARGARPRSSSPRSTRTSPTASGCSSTSPSARSRTRRSRIRRRRCRRSTACTTSCASSRAGRSPTAATATSRRAAADRADDELGRLRPPRVRRDPHGRRGSPQVSRRLKAALEDLRSIAPPDRVAILDEQLDLLAAATETAMDDGATSTWRCAGPRGNRRRTIRL